MAKSVVGAAITKLISMFNPAGAVIQAIIAVYNTVQFFIERRNRSARSPRRCSTGRGDRLGRARRRKERRRERTRPQRARRARVPRPTDRARRIAAPVRNVMTTVRGAIDKAIDKALGFLIKLAAPMINAAKKLYAKGKAAVKKLYAKGKAAVTGAIDKAKAKILGGDDTPEGKQKRLNRACGWAGCCRRPVCRAGDVQSRSHAVDVGDPAAVRSDVAGAHREGRSLGCGER